MDSRNPLCADCANGIWTDFAKLRILTAAFLRGEIELEPFGRLWGELILHHDIAVANRKLDVQLAAAAESGGSGAGRHRSGEPSIPWPAADVPVVDVEDSCMAPASHDGSGDCGCPAIGED